MTYPTLSPSSRTYSHGDWPVSNHRFMTGRSQRTLHANAKTQQTLKLTYENQPLEDFDAVLLHYEQQQGTNKAFKLPEIALFEGWNKEGQDDALLGSAQLWRYNSEPRIRSRRGGLGTLEVDLITSLQQAERLYDCPTSAEPRQLPTPRTTENPDDPSNNPYCGQYIEDINPPGSPTKRYVIGNRIINTPYDIFDCYNGSYRGTTNGSVSEGNFYGLDPVRVTARSIKVTSGKIWRKTSCGRPQALVGNSSYLLVEAQREDGSWYTFLDARDYAGIVYNFDLSTTVHYSINEVKYITADGRPLNIDIPDGIPNSDGSCGDPDPEPDPDGPGPGPNPNPLPLPPEECGGGGGGGGGITQPQPPANPPISRPPIDIPDDPGNGPPEDDGGGGGPGEPTLECPLGYKDNGFGKCVVDLEAKVGGYMRFIEGRGTTVPAFQSRQPCGAAPYGTLMGPAGGYDFRVPYGPYDIDEDNTIEDELFLINNIRGYRIGVSWKSDDVEDPYNVIIPLDSTVKCFLNAAATSSRWGLSTSGGFGVGPPIDSPVSDFYQEQIDQGLFKYCIVRRGCISGFDGTPNKCDYTYKVSFLPIGYIDTVLELYPDFYKLQAGERKRIIMDLFCGGAKNSTFIPEIGSASTRSITPVSALNTTTQTFPNISPSRRNITYGDWTINRFGSEQEVTLPLPSTAKKSDVIMDLVYANREDSVARSFLQHYDGTSGTFNNFSVADINPDKGTFAGWDGPISDNISKGHWVYANAPRVVSVHPGFSTTTVRLINLEPELIDNSNSHAFTDSICPGYGSDTGGGVTSYGNTEQLLRRFNVLNTRSTIDTILPPGWPTNGPFPQNWSCDTPVPGKIRISLPNNFGTEGNLCFTISSSKYFYTNSVRNCRSTYPPGSTFGPKYYYNETFERNNDSRLCVGAVSAIDGPIDIGPWSDNCSAGNFAEVPCGEVYTGNYQPDSCTEEVGVPGTYYYCRRLVFRGQWESSGEPKCATVSNYGSNTSISGGDSGTWAHFNVITNIVATVTFNGEATETTVYGPISVPDDYSAS